METDPIEQALDEGAVEAAEVEADHDIEYVNIIESSTEWSSKRDSIALAMWNSGN